MIKPKTGRISATVELDYIKKIEQDAKKLGTVNKSAMVALIIKQHYEKKKKRLNDRI